MFTVTGDTPVSGFSRAKDRIDAEILKLQKSEAMQRGDSAAVEPIPHWTVHDLRRTGATGLARLGVNLPAIEKILNHSSGSFRGCCWCLSAALIRRREAACIGSMVELRASHSYRAAAIECHPTQRYNMNASLPCRPLFRFTSEQWKLLATPLGLPLAARAELQSTIDIFQRFRDSSAEQLSAGKMKKQLKVVSRDCDRLLRGLKALDSRALRALISDSDPSSPRRARDGLETFVERQDQILALRNWCNLAVKRTGPDASGPAAQAANLEWLVRGIGGVLSRHKDIPLRRTKLIISFVEEACRIAIPNVGGSSIDEAMKSVIASAKVAAR